MVIRVLTIARAWNNESNQKKTNLIFLRVCVVIIRFSQKWAKEKYRSIVPELIHFVQGTRRCPDLLVKIFVYASPTPLSKGFQGNYRNVFIHGSYPSDHIRGTKVTSIITLKVPSKVKYDPTVEPEGRSERDYPIDIWQFRFVGLFGHEFKHYLDMRTLRDKTKYRHWEVRAEEFAKQMREKWKQHN